jgi:predicted amidohydrolase
MKVAVIQMNSVKSVEANLVDAYDHVQQAANQNARFIALPEMFACLGVSNQIEIASRYFKGNLIEKSIGAWAEKYNVFILAGSVPYATEQKPDRVYASSFLLSPQGKIVTRYDKIHLFDVDVGDEKGGYCESNTFLPGATPKTASIDDSLLGLSICYDLRFPELYQYYQQQKCQMIAVPSAFTFQTGAQHWEILLRARAIETQSFILAANQVGVHEDGRRTWGHSMIVSPSGEILAEIYGDKPGVVVADLDFTAQKNLRSAMPLMQHKRDMPSE